MSPLLQLHQVRKTYGDKVVLDGIDLQVDPHDVICLIGASGSGKSTLLRCINLLEEIQDGQIFWQGEEISDPLVDARRIRTQIGMVFQAYNLFPHMSVLHNCTLAPIKVAGVTRAEAEATAEELLRRFGLADKITSYPDQLSGGQQQRVALVRALCTDPQLLMLDEITAALDPMLVREVLEIVRAQAAAGTTMLLATHEMAFAREVATRVCFLSQGRIIEEGPPEQLFDHPRHQLTQEFLSRLL